MLNWRNLADEDAARKTATEFVRLGVHVIVAFENQTVRAAKSATSRVPIVFLHVTGPAADGLVDSLARPGRNLTGVADSDFDLLPTDLEIYMEFLPRDYVRGSACTNVARSSARTRGSVTPGRPMASRMCCR